MVTLRTSVINEWIWVNKTNSNVLTIIGAFLYSGFEKGKLDDYFNAW